MADISKCEGKDCPIKIECYRYTSPVGYLQAYIETPGRFVKNKFQCSFFWLKDVYDRANDLSQKFIKKFNEKAK